MPTDRVPRRGAPVDPWAPSPARRLRCPAAARPARRGPGAGRVGRWGGAGRRRARRWAGRASSRAPTRPGSRGRSSQARASTAHRCSGPAADQTSAAVVGTHSGATPSLSATRSAATATSTSSAATGLVGVHLAGDPPQVAHTQAARAEHARAGSRRQNATICSTWRSARNAAPAAVPSTTSTPRSTVSTSGGATASGPERPVAPQRQPDLTGQLDGLGVEAREQPAREQPGDGARRICSGAAAADRRAGGQRVEHPALVRVDLGEEPLQRRRGRHTGAGPPKAAGEPRDDVARGRDEGDPGPLGAGHVRSEESQARARARREASAASRASGGKPGPSRRRSSSRETGALSASATTSASTTCSATVSSSSQARCTDARMPARVASTVRSAGGGTARSGRSRSRSASVSSSWARSQSTNGVGISSTVVVAPASGRPVEPAARLPDGSPGTRAGS